MIALVRCSVTQIFGFSRVPIQLIHTAIGSGYSEMQCQRVRDKRPTLFPSLYHSCLPKRARRSDELVKTLCNLFRMPLKYFIDQDPSQQRTE